MPRQLATSKSTSVCLEHEHGLLTGNAAVAEVSTGIDMLDTTSLERFMNLNSKCGF